MSRSSLFERGLGPFFNVKMFIAEMVIAIILSVAIVSYTILLL